ELAFDHVLVIEQDGELGQLVFRQVAGVLVGADPRPLAELVGEERADPVDVAQRDHRALVVRDVDTEDTRHPSDLPVSIPTARRAAGKLTASAPPAPGSSA